MKREDRRRGGGQSKDVQVRYVFDDAVVPRLALVHGVRDAIGLAVGLGAENDGAAIANLVGEGASRVVDGLPGPARVARDEGAQLLRVVLDEIGAKIAAANLRREA